MRLSVLTACSFVLLSDSAFAQNAIQPGTLDLYATHSAVGMEFGYSGDENRNAITDFVWKRSRESEWHKGVDVTVDAKRRLIHASVWPLKPGEEIQVRITIRDPDVPKPTTREARTRVRSFPTMPDKSETIYVSPDGDDSNPGTRDKPLKTLAHAAKRVKPGGVIRALPGTYPEGNLFQRLNGTKDNPIFIVGPANGEAVIDSSTVIAKGQPVWKEAGDGVYAAVVRFDGGYVAQDGKRAYPCPSLAALKTDSHKVRRCWFYDKTRKTLYVRTGTGRPPGEHRYRLSQHPYAIWLTGSRHVVVSGFTMRNYGAAVIRLSEGAQGCVIRKNTLSNAPGGIFMKGTTTRDNAIWHNHVYEPGLPDFSWKAIYAVGYGNQAIYCTKAGRGNSFCYNRIHDYFDLISVESWRNPDRIEYNRDCDVLFNTLYNAGDDAIELDGGGVNMRVHGNRIRNCLTAISLAPIERGPVFVTRNHATFLGLMFKFNVNGCTSHGHTFCYHNSGYCLITGADGGTGVSFPPRIPCSNKVLKNNVVVSNEWSVRAGKKAYVLDGNCYFNVPGKPPRRFQWEGRRFNTIDQFRSATGQEMHGIYANPLFQSSDGVGRLRARDLTASLSNYEVLKDATAGDLQLQSNSPCIDRGVRIRGINDRYQGRGPDVGAFEVNAQAK